MILYSNLDFSLRIRKGNKLDIIKKRPPHFSNGKPKICVPLTGKSEYALNEQAQAILATACDIVEWRVDLFEHVESLDLVIAQAQKLRQILAHLPILFTFRTVKEGGNTPLSDQNYLLLNTSLIKAGLIDLVDVELFMGDAIVNEIVQLAHHHQVTVIMSNHDFAATPTEDDIVQRLCKMQNFGAGVVPKIAVMPICAEDVLTLLSATCRMKKQYPQTPIITISMGRLGMISRFAGEIFGSVMTFAVVSQASAPGQVCIKSLQPMLDLLHQSE